MIAMLRKSIIFIEGGLLNMKKAAHILYTIAKWFQLAYVILAALWSVVALIVFIVHTAAGDFPLGLGSLIASIIFLAIEIAAWIVINIAIKKQKEDSKDKAPHIICIVVGVISQNYLYVAGAILSLIMISKGQEVEPIQAISKEQVKSAVKKDKKEDVKDVDSKEKPAEEKAE